MITTTEIICDLFSFLDKDQIERSQLVNEFWNSVIIRHKNILPLRQFITLNFNYEHIQLQLYAIDHAIYSYTIKFDGTSLSKIEENASSRYSQLTVDKVLTNLNDVVFDSIQIMFCDSEDRLDNFLNLIKLVTTKSGGRFRGKSGSCNAERFGSKLAEIFDNYIIVDELTLDQNYNSDSYIREVCANPEIVQLPSTPKEIRLEYLEFKENDEVLNFTCNGKLNGANRLTIELHNSDRKYENFIRQWFELYCSHENPISLVGKFGICNFRTFCLNFGKFNVDFDIVLDAVKTFLNNTQLRVKYSLETKEFHYSLYDFRNLKRRCVLHETDSYALVIEMLYEVETDMSSINASDLDQPPCDQMKAFSFCVKSV